MLLKYLNKNLPKKFRNLQIKGLALNSREVKKGFIFFAVNGTNSNGERYINQAIKKGAKIVICSKKCKLRNFKATIFKVRNLRKLLGEMTSKFYKKKPKNIFAVTGTNGKTSVANFFHQILSSNNIPVASIGTLGIKYKDKTFQTKLTSPDIITLHKYLQKIKERKIDNVIIEASSHGLDQNRLNNINFKAGVFTNFSQDHLDYHKTMKKYLNSKLTLFSKLLPKKSYAISDSSLKQFSILKKISKKRKLKLLDIKDQNLKADNFRVPLVGSFQKKNLLMAASVAKLCNLSNKKIIDTIKNIKSVNGRLDLVKTYSGNINVFVDYAHTPEALKETVLSLKQEYKNNLTLVFGCGGERDTKKRSIMAKIAKAYCDKIYVTDDNPRNESPIKIRKDITKHLKGSRFFDIGRRSVAIKQAIKSAEPNETILIAGKGHENTQDYGQKIFFASDKDIIKKLKINKKKYNNKNQNYYSNSKILEEIVNKKKSYNVNGVSIDSRQIKKDNLFLAIKGKNNDGNKFINNALKDGASFAITSKNYKHKNKKVIKVKNTEKFLREFGILKRKNSNAKILAITGSAGKTTLKNMLQILLEKFEPTHSSPKSFNNHYGVPLSLANLNQSHKFGIFEVGMSKPGEIHNLSKMIKPNLAIITNIAEAHIENFKNLKGIAKAKSEIIDNVKRDGTIILNRDDKFFSYLSKKAKYNKLKIISYGKSKNSDVHLVKTNIIRDEKELTVKVFSKKYIFRINDINIYNVLASLAVLEELNLNISKSINVFNVLKPSEGRGKIHRVKRYNKKFNLIDESYNANPLSVKNALINFSLIKKKKSKKYLLLGDMLELGKKSEKYHENLSKLINSSDIDKVFIQGEKTINTYKTLKKDKRGNIFQCNQDIDFFLKNIIAKNDYLMVKGSNATGLNSFCKTIIKGV